MASSISFNKKTTIKAPLKRVFKWHERPAAFQRLTPPWIKIQDLGSQPGIINGTKKSFRIKLGPFWLTWKIVHEEYVKNEQFTDIQTKGPFKSWVHKHKFKTDTQGNTVLEDRILYKTPFNAITKWILQPIVQSKLKRLFSYRHEILKKDLQTHHQAVRGKRLRILIVGSSGLIGQELKIFLQSQGHEVIELSHRPRKGALDWDPTKNKLRPKILEDLDAVINLSGSPILGRWTEARKKLIYESRVESTMLLAKKLAKTKNPPRVLINASGINIYGSHRQERLHEQSNLGDNEFLSNLCKDWEDAANHATKAGTRVVNLRIGMVLSPKGGALKLMLPVFNGCLGGRMGNGLQSISWVAMDDLTDIIYHCIINTQIIGPVNATAPHHVSNFTFKQALAKKLKRPAWLPIPAFLVKLLFGQMAKETILSSLKVQPQKLLASGYKFRYPRIDQALKHLIE